MIHLELLRKNIRDGAWLWFWCALTLFNLGWLHVWVTSRLDTAEEVSVYEAGGVLQRFAQDFLAANK